MDTLAVIGMTSIFVAGFTMAIGSIGPAIAQGRAVEQALRSIAQQPDESDTLSRFVAPAIPVALVQFPGFRAVHNSLPAGCNVVAGH